MQEYRFETFFEQLGGSRGVVRLEGKQALEVAPPPEFGGLPDTWSPEDLFVSAVDSCLMMTFAFLARSRGLLVASYKSHAVGVLTKEKDGLRFTQVEVYPELTVEGGPDQVHLARELLHKAEGQCLVARSLSCPVKVFPFVEAAGTAAIVGPR